VTCKIKHRDSKVHFDSTQNQRTWEKWQWMLPFSEIIQIERGVGREGGRGARVAWKRKFKDVQIYFEFFQTQRAQQEWPLRYSQLTSSTIEAITKEEVESVEQNEQKRVKSVRILSKVNKNGKNNSQPLFFSENLKNWGLRLGPNETWKCEFNPKMFKYIRILPKLTSTATMKITCSVPIHFENFKNEVEFRRGE